MARARRRQRHGPPGDAARRRDRDREGAALRHRLGRLALQQPRRAGVAVCAHAAGARHDRPVLRGGQRQPPAALGRAGHAAVDQSDRGGGAGRRASRRWCWTWRPRWPPTARSRPRRSAARRCRVGWMIDRLGQPLTDPKRAEEGFLLPIGGYKGYGLALIVGLAGRHAQRRGDGPRRDRLQPRRHQHHQHRPGRHGDRLERLRRRRAISRPASTGWCATCAPASACPASSASGCRASRATSGAPPTSATAFPCPRCCTGSCDGLRPRDRHRRRSTRSTQRRRQHDITPPPGGAPARIAVQRPGRGAGAGGRIPASRFA